MPGTLPFKQLKRSHLYEEVADQIKQAIFDGIMKPGDPLPSERNLCDLFGVGRPTIREALRILNVMGLIEIHPGIKGSVVKKVDITQYLESLREQLACLIQVDKKTVADIWEVRKSMEIGIAHAAAQRASEKDFQRLEELIEKMEQCRDDIDAYFPLAAAFHQQLAMASGNSIFYIIWNMFHDIVLKGFTPILDELFPEGPSKLLDANKMVLAAIKSGNRTAIDKAMENHATQELRLLDNPETSL